MISRKIKSSLNVEGSSYYVDEESKGSRFQENYNASNSSMSSAGFIMNLINL